MLQTKFLNLKKPEGADPVNVQDFNENADTIDTEINARVKTSGGDISNTKIATAETITTEFPAPAAGEAPKTLVGKMKKFVEDFKNWKTGVCLLGQIVNNCVTDNAKLPLSAAQGKALMELYTVLNTNLGNLSTSLNGFAVYSYNSKDTLDFNTEELKRRGIHVFPGTFNNLLNIPLSSTGDTAMICTGAKFSWRVLYTGGTLYLQALSWDGTPGGWRKITAVAI